MPVGILSKLYFNSGSYGTPTWVEVNLVSDLVVDATWNEAEGSTRAEQAQVFEPTNLKLDLTGKIRKNILDTPYLMIRAAHLVKTSLDILILDRSIATVGADGFRFEGKVFNWSEDQGLGTVIFKEFGIKPCIPSVGYSPQLSNFAAATIPKSALVATPNDPTFSFIGSTG